MSADQGRHLGLFGATAIGVGAIVGGGILALAGVAFATTGPSAILAFALNGAIAFLTAASFSELARRFPQSGGTYTYAKRVLSIEVAFVVGWVVWFASIVAGVLYALGFAAFAAQGVVELSLLLGSPIEGLDTRIVRAVVALLATAAYTIALMRSAGGGGNGATIGKVVVFAILLLGGTAAWLWRGAAEGPALLAGLDPFFAEGPSGFVRAMGYTFIALQGFDLIAAVGGEVRDPERNLPRSMMLSLAIALAIYLPLLFFIATVGAPAEGTLREAAAANPEGVVAEAARRFLGAPGYWLVIGAGILSMLSALQANLLGASRVAFAMARDRTLPRPLGRMRGTSGTPALAVAVTAAMLALVVLAVGDVSAAGAASSLIFLISFATVHWSAALARRRSGDPRVPIVPLVGAVLCMALATFQAWAVPAAGSVVVAWLGIGVLFYLILLAPGARLADATAEARDPDLARLRGRSPLVLVPVANPASAASLMGVASTVRTPGVGRILLHSVVRTPDEVPDEDDPALRDAQAILAEALYRGFERGTAPETLITIAPDVWNEIARVAREHRCETVLLGTPDLMTEGVEAQVERLLGAVDADAVVVRAPRRWRVAQVRSVLVPVGGRRDHSQLRARLLASLTRNDDCTIQFLGVVPTNASPDFRLRTERELQELARDEAEGHYQVVIEHADDPVEAIVRRAEEADMLVLGMQRRRRAYRSLGKLAVEVAKTTSTPMVLIDARRTQGRR